MLSGTVTFHNIVQFLKDWTPLWLAILAFLLNAYNQNLKSYREQRKEARIYFLKHRMLLKPLERVLDDYQTVIAVNKRKFQDWLWTGIEDISLDGLIDYNHERVIGYCVYNRQGDEQNLFRLYLDFINKYNLLITQAKEFESSMNLFFSIQKADVEKLNNLYMSINRDIREQLLYVEIDGKRQIHPLSEKIDQLFRIDLKDYYLEFIMPLIEYDLFKSKCVDRLQEIYRTHLDENQDLNLNDSDPLRQRINEIADQLKVCVSNTEYWLTKSPIEHVFQTLKDLYYLIDQIEHIPFKGHKWYAWLAGR
jgi:hypothetical protein